MQVNKEQIPGIPDILLLAAKKKLIRSKKRPLSNAIQDVPLINLVYQLINNPKRELKVFLQVDLDISPLTLLYFFITKPHFDLISTYININAKTKYITNQNVNSLQKEEKESKKSASLLTKNIKYIQVQNDTTAAKIPKFEEILLLQKEAKVKNTAKYWNSQPD